MMRIKKHVGVRTTLAIDDQLLEKARHLAQAEGVSLGTVVNRSLRQTLLAPAIRSSTPGFRMLTFQGDAPLTSDLAPETIARLRDADSV